ncbi:MAG: SusC/RagA family TonB-linked outer membrane protein, partial [Alistipes sp.]|nr:SusC/RagA family TonB-linked outer membrane protein [Alistipes sp.]
MTQPVGGRTSVNVVMQEDAVSIGTVVAIGYGNQRKEDLSMAVSTLRVDDALRSRSNGSDVSTLLQGRIPGLTVMQSGDPAVGSTFSIRGRGSKGDDNDPNKTDGVLIVVDGVPGAPYSVDDIEEISVLKDAASASIYGAQVGAGGVILITTKKAQAGKTRLDVNVSTGFQKVTNLPKVLTAEQYNQVWQDQSAKYGTNLPDRSNTTIYPYGNVTRTDWLDEIYRTGKTNHVSATLSGGNEKTLNLFSISYDNNEGVLKNTYSKAITAKMSTDFTPFKWLRFSERMNVKMSRAQGNIDTGHQGPIIAALWYPRSATVYEMNDDGTYMLDDNGKRIYGGTSPRANAMSDYPNVYNPVAVLDKLHRKYPQNEFYSTTGLEIRPVGGLVLRSDFSGSYTYKEADEFYPVMDAPGLMRTENSREQFYDKFKKWLSETTATYSEVFGKHHVSAMIGFSANWEYQNYKTIYTGDYQYETEEGMLWGSANQWTNRKMEEAAYKFSMVSVISRLGYSYDDRYFVVGSVRRDASSKLPSTKNYDVFPAVSGSWKLTSEHFFRDLGIERIFTMIKLRAGWGKIGNVDSYDLANITDISISNVSYPIILGQNSNNQIYGTYIGTIANPYAKWETTKQTSAGLDVSMLSGRLDLTIDFYNKDTKDLVDVLDLVPHMGVDNPPYGNLGHVVNRGWEFSASFHDRVGDWSYGAWEMYNYNKGYVKNYGSVPIYYHEGAGQLITSNRILASGAGYPWRSFYVYRTAGIFQSQDEIDQYVWKDPQTGQTKILQPNAKVGDIRWVDTNNDGVISEADRVFIGSYDPKHTFSFGGSVSWKGIDLSVMFQGVAGNYIYNTMKQLSMRVTDGAK